jgi:hypothetical protein
MKLLIYIRAFFDTKSGINIFVFFIINLASLLIQITKYLLIFAFICYNFIMNLSNSILNDFYEYISFKEILIFNLICSILIYSIFFYFDNYNQPIEFTLKNFIQREKISFSQSIMYQYMNIADRKAKRI